MHMQEWVITKVYSNECIKSQVCKLFVFTDGAVTWDLPAMP